MQYVADNLRDFLLYFGGSWIGKEDKEKPEKPVHVFQVHSRRGEDRANVKLIPATKSFLEPGQNYIEDDWRNVVENYILYPKQVGMTNVGPTVMYVTRVPQRQYRKGFNLGSCNIFCPAFKELEKVKQYPSEQVIVESCFNAFRSTLTQALKEITSGQAVGRALSRYFGVHCLPQYKEIIFLYKNINIGTVTPDGVISLHYPYKAYLEGVGRVFGPHNVKVVNKE